MSKSVTISEVINVPVSKVWNYYTNPDHIIKYNFATDEWECPIAQSNFIEGGKFNYKMQAKDGSFGFDYSGTFDKIIANELLEYTLDDNRKVKISFKANNNDTELMIDFEPEKTNPIELQKAGWQAILTNFKIYAERIA